jgi:hypothetical protein
MSWFYKLPECLLRSILSEWSEMRGVGRLDSATCNGERATYLHIVAGGMFASVREFVRNAKDANKVMRWFIKRNMGIARIGNRQVIARSTSFKIDNLKSTTMSEKLTWYEVHIYTLCGKCHFWPITGTCPKGFVWILHEGVYLTPDPPSGA